MGIQNSIELIFPGLPKTPETSEYFFITVGIKSKCSLANPFPLSWKK